MIATEYTDEGMHTFAFTTQNIKRYSSYYILRHHSKNKLEEY